jgi:predicted DsbA family dithiol-disulfide isomerase
MAADVVITEFTDPACPWAFSAEPFRLHLDWLYGDAIDWRPRMVGLSETPEEYERKGLTPKMLAEGMQKIAIDHGMPMDSAEPERMQATVPACRAVVAARLHAPERERALLRRLRVLNFTGHLLDAPETVEMAAHQAGLDGELNGWVEDASVEEALRDDMARAREPMPAARVLDEKLANWSGGRRYTCPSYEIRRESDGTTISIPGFQPFASYDVVLANLCPDLGRRAESAGIEEVLAWAEIPLATREVAEICGLEDRDAREQLSRVAEQDPVGADGFWSLAA